jgi:hypothetical protein
MSDHSDHMKEAATFAENVRRELRSFPADVVADLTDGLESDIASSLADGASLSSPESYAHDLLRGAGLEPIRESEESQSFLSKATTLVRPLWTKVRALTAGLAPAWWVFRAWIATQLLGAMMSEVNSPYGIIGEWGEMPLGALIVFAGFLALSIRFGRMTQERFARTRLISHLLFVVAALPVLSIQPTPDVWASYAPMSPEQSYCPMMTVPNVTGLIIVEAQLAIDAAGLDYFFYDQFSNEELEIVPPDAVVIRQSPLRDKYWCTWEKIQLTIDTSLPRSTDSATTMPPEGVTPDTRGGQTTTTIPSKSSTTTVPKATTTTRP